MRSLIRTTPACLAALLLWALPAVGESSKVTTLVDATKALDAKAVSAVDAQFRQEHGRLEVRVGHTAERPGISFSGPDGRWNMIGFGEVQATIGNPGKHPISIHCSLESPGANRTSRLNCCIESVTIPPGEEAVVKVKMRARVPENLREKLRGMRGAPGGFIDNGRGAVDPSNVTAIGIYFYRPKSDQVFTVSNIRATGQPAFPLPAQLDRLFPMIDRYGQYIHRDWPGKIHSDADFARQRETERHDLAANIGPSNWNQYGGWLGGPQLEATGRFRVAKWHDRWWFVDPEGRLFWSHGLVRVTWSSGYTPVTGREHLFADLPGRDTPLGAFFGQSTWSIAGQYDRGTETYNFSGANLLRKYGDDWAQVFAALSHRRMRSWGINTLANCSQPAIYLQRKTPYTATVYSLSQPPGDTPGATGYVATIHNAGRVIAGTSGGWGKFPDVFDPSFKTTLMAEIAQHRGKAIGDPWCLGYFPGNELNWGKDEAAIGRAVLASPVDQPAKLVLVEGLKAKYSSIQELNKAWKTDYASWNAVVASVEPPPAPAGHADLSAFLEKLADAYFRQCREAVKESDPQGLYLGCRFAGWSHPLVFRAAAKYSDVVSVNRYTDTLADLKLPDGIDKPVLIGEFHFGALDRGKFHASLREVANQEARGAAYEKYVRSSLENPLVVGTHWHQFSDQATTGRDDGENFQNGFTDVCDTPYVETVAACRKVAYRMYETRAEAKP